MDESLEAICFLAFFFYSLCSLCRKHLLPKNLEEWDRLRLRVVRLRRRQIGRLYHRGLMHRNHILVVLGSARIGYGQLLRLVECGETGTLHSD
jgi:hypothetical protein